MLLGSWVATRLPTRDSAIDLPFLLPGKVEQEIEMRIGSVKVNQVRTTSEIQFEKAYFNNTWNLVGDRY